MQNMGNKITVHSISGFTEFTLIIEDMNKDRMVLFRGQSEDKPLLPKIARKDPKRYTTEREKKMIKELQRRIGELPNARISTDWDWLALAQHNGMSTRLLDWTTNPLVALWFACNKDEIEGEYSVVWYFVVPDDAQLNIEKDKDPFAMGETKVYKPKIIGRALESQSGWFTSHKYSIVSKQFVPLERNSRYKSYLGKIRIPKNIRGGLVNVLDTCGINSSSVFPDIEGLCHHINRTFL